jgi:hypothetical protein
LSLSSFCGDTKVRFDPLLVIAAFEWVIKAIPETTGLAVQPTKTIATCPSFGQAGARRPHISLQRRPMDAAYRRKKV